MASTRSTSSKVDRSNAYMRVEKDGRTMSEGPESTQRRHLTTHPRRRFALLVISSSTRDHAGRASAEQSRTLMAAPET